MSKGADKRALLIDATRQGPEVLKRISSVSEQAGLSVRLLAMEDSTGGLREMIETAEDPSVILIGPHLEQPVAVARVCCKVAPLVHLIFLTDTAHEAALRQTLSSAVMIGFHWTLVNLQSEGIGGSIAEAVRSTRQRTQLRTTLDRIGAQVASTVPEPFSVTLEKMVEKKTEEVKAQKVAALNLLQSAKKSRIRAEKAEKKFRGMLESAPDAMVIVNREGRIMLVNAQTQTLFGYKREELLDQPVEILIPQRFRGNHHGHRKTYFAGPRVRSMGSGMELYGLRKDGTEFPVEISLSPLETEEGMLVSSAIRDITERKQTEEALRASEEKFRAAAETANDAIISSDSFGKITYLNRSAEHMFGYDVNELMGKPLTLLMPERFREAHQAGLRRYVATEEGRVIGTTVELAGLRRDGTEFPLEISLANWKTVDGIFFTAIIRDITERKQAVERIQKLNDELELRVEERTAELKRSNKDLEQFAYVASHDLQEPLRTVISYAELLAKRYRGQLGEKADKFINYLVDGATRMQILINDLLSYSRVGTQGKPFEPVDCEKVFGRGMANLRRAIAETGAVITRDDLPTVMGDSSQLTQLFQNLVGNALKYRGADPLKVHVGVVQKEGEWVFSIRDNGIGINARYTDRIFVIFQRLHTRSEFPGTGIGLAICKKIVERHGGRIWVSSEEGRGSNFQFTIPDRER